MSIIDPDVDAYVTSVDDVGLDQPTDDGSIEEHTIALDVPHPLTTTVTPGDSPYKLVLTSVAFPCFGNDNIHTAALDLPHVLLTNRRVPSYDIPHTLSIGVHEEGLEDRDLGDEEVILASDPIMRPHPKSALVDN